MPRVMSATARPPDAKGPVDNPVCVLVGPRRMTWMVRRLPPEPREGWVRLRFLYCGVCGSDLSCFEGRRGSVYPLSLGHEFVAVVERLGKGVRDLEVGDLVVSDLQFRCGACTYCRTRRSHLCESGREGLFTNRGLAERADIDRTYLVRISGSGPLPRMTLAEPLSCVLHGLEGLPLHTAARVAVVGSGSIGSCMAFALVRAGVTFDVVESHPERRRRIALCLPAGSSAVAEADGHYDLVLDASGTPAGMLYACRLLEPGGLLSSMSHLDGHAQDGRFLALFSRKDATLRMSHLNGEPHNLRRAVELLEDRWVGPWDDLLAVHTTTEVQEVFARRHESPGNKDVVDCSVFGAGPCG